MFLTLAAVAALLTAQTKRPIALDDQHKFLDVADPQCSPDGKWIAYTLTTTDTKEDKRDTDLWMVSVDGMQIRLTIADGRIKVEHDDAAAAAQALGRPLRDVLAQAINAAAVLD